MGAIIAVPFQNLSAFGVDQLNAQRMFCCRNANDARKAMIAGSGSSSYPAHAVCGGDYSLFTNLCISRF